MHNKNLQKVIALTNKSVFSDTRNTRRRRRTTEQLETVRATGERYRDALDKLAAAGTSEQLRKKMETLFEKVDVAAPALLLQHRKSKTLGVVDDFELLRRLQGDEGIGGRAQEARAYAAEVLQELENAHPGFAAAVRSKREDRTISRAYTVLKAARVVAAAVSIACTGLAAHLYLNNGSEDAFLASVGVGVAGATAAVLLGRARTPHNGKKPYNEAAEEAKTAIRKVINSLDELIGDVQKS